MPPAHISLSALPSRRAASITAYLGYKTAIPIRPALTPYRPVKVHGIFYSFIFTIRPALAPYRHVKVHGIIYSCTHGIRPALAPYRHVKVHGIFYSV
jgi:hypothetical protein